MTALDSRTGGRAGLVHTLLDGTAASTPQAVAVSDGYGRWNYAEVADHSRAVHAWLADRGVLPGQRVVVQLPTTRELVALFYGTVRSGAVFVPLNPAMKSFHLSSVLDNADPALVVVDDASVQRVSELTQVPVIGFGEVWNQVQGLRMSGRSAVPVEVLPEDIAVLVYTSGSTAAPKAVVCPHAQITFASRALVSELGYRAEDVVFCRFPMSWDYGLYKVVMCTAVGAEIVLADGDSDLLLLKRIRASGATVVPIVPSLATMIATLAAREEEAAPTVRMFTNTGAALPPSTIDSLRAAFPGVRVVRQFGQTECKRISVMPPEQDGERPDSVGRPLPGTLVRILDSDGTQLPVGQVGEIVVSGPHVMPGYWRSPEQTARNFRYEPVTGELRLHTGDYGRLDADGYLYFEGRRDDMFKRKGIRMSTVEIEAAAMDIPGVRAAAALPPGQEHDLLLFVDADLAPHAVLRELATRLEPAKVPAACHVVEDIPLTLHGKNERKQLLALIEGGRR
ncbi:AMP-binding protein [Kutzneria albida]|uniref:O-succinylbenzoate-CoA ligase n=1 Tax=Kutzneria albida DSM 43870 TaxID=1449976 RepID=W5W0Z7_9PSEU|nr:AMP-binding protein [Kutzneria albida]AHH94853.1 O-succinylbenzoate-CoA ligase [Kutzneria albida DSM 43870]